MSVLAESRLFYIVELLPVLKEKLARRFLSLFRRHKAHPYIALEDVAQTRFGDLCRGPGHCRDSVLSGAKEYFLMRTDAKQIFDIRAESICVPRQDPACIYINIREGIGHHSGVASIGEPLVQEHDLRFCQRQVRGIKRNEEEWIEMGDIGGAGAVEPRSAGVDVDRYLKFGG